MPAVFLAVLLLASVATGASTQAVVETPRAIRVVLDNAYAPYSFQSDDGKLQGILIDQWRAWEKKTGIKVEIRAMDWGEALRRMRAGEFDVIESIVETHGRRDYLDFTPAYGTVEASIYFRNDISGITDLASLKGFPVAVKAGDQHIDQLKASGVTAVILFPNNDAIVEAARQRKINIFVADAPSTLYLLNKMGIESEFRHSGPIFRDELRRAVRKGDTNLRTVSEGFSAISSRELKKIDEKWFGRTIDSRARYLVYGAYAVAVAMLLAAGLVGWNRSLRKGIRQQTAALQASALQLQALSQRLVEVQEAERKEPAPEGTEAGSEALARLSPRERQVLELVVAGKTSKEISASLGIAAASVDTYRSRIMQKLSIEDLPALVRFAIRHRITSV